MESRRIAIIGASYLQLPLVRRAKELGLYTICFAWPQGAVCKDIADEFHPVSIVEKEVILDICQRSGINGICTIASDVAAPTVAYVAEQMGLIGNTYQAAVDSHNKYLMRQKLSEVGLPCPQYCRIDSLDDISNVRLHFPVIVKPTDRSGSLGVTKVEDSSGLRTALMNALGSSLGEEAIVEEYVEGREVSVEFISYQGKHYPLQITDKVTSGSPYFVELEQHQPAELSREQYSQLYRLTERTLQALGITNGASHCEYKITREGTPYIIEIGARMGGDFIGSDLVQLSTGYDFLRGVIEVALGDFSIPTFCGSDCAGVYFLCKETEYLLPMIENPSLREMVKAEILDGKLKEVKSSSDRSGYLIYKSKDKLILRPDNAYDRF